VQGVCVGKGGGSLACRGVPVSTSRRRVWMLLSARAMPLAAFRRMWPSSQTSISGPGHTRRLWNVSRSLRSFTRLPVVRLRYWS
jgi:hypothetical protein